MIHLLSPTSLGGTTLSKASPYFQMSDIWYYGLTAFLVLYLINNLIHSWLLATCSYRTTSQKQSTFYVWCVWIILVSMWVPITGMKYGY